MGASLKQHDCPVLDQGLARLQPLIFEHINILGRYSFAVPERSPWGNCEHYIGQRKNCCGLQ